MMDRFDGAISLIYRIQNGFYGPLLYSDALTSFKIEYKLYFI